MAGTLVVMAVMLVNLYHVKQVTHATIIYRKKDQYFSEKMNAYFTCYLLLYEVTDDSSHTVLLNKWSIPWQSSLQGVKKNNINDLIWKRTELTILCPWSVQNQRCPHAPRSHVKLTQVQSRETKNEYAFLYYATKKLAVTRRKYATI